MSKQSNPPIGGHELINEGQIAEGWFNSSGERTVVGGCRCGAMPDEWRTMSVNAVKRWHREHKQTLRANREAAWLGEQRSIAVALDDMHRSARDGFDRAVVRGQPQEAGGS